MSENRPDDTQPAIRTHEMQIAQPTPPEETRPRSTIPGLRADYVLLWLLTLGSLAQNVLLLRQIAIAWGVTRQAIDDAIIVLEDFQDQRFAYTVKIDETLPIRAEIPVQTTIPVHVDEIIPVSGNALVPFNTPLGTFDITVPIETTVPLDLTVDVTIDQSFPVSTDVPVKLDVPLEVTVRETPLSATLDDVQARLEELRERMNIRLPLMGSGEPELDVIE
jgi:hypothetical protein